MDRLELVGDILAEQHSQEGASPGDVRQWRLGFQVGVGVEMSDQLRRARMAVAGA